MTTPNLDLLNSALDFAGEQALHNARICGGEAKLSAWLLIDSIEWAKRVLATAADGGYDRHDIDPADALRDHLRDCGNYPAGEVNKRDSNPETLTIQDPRGLRLVSCVDDANIDFDDLPF